MVTFADISRSRLLCPWQIVLPVTIEENALSRIFFIRQLQHSFRLTQLSTCLKFFLSITFEKLRITYDHTLELEMRFQLNSFHYSQHLIQTTYYVSNVRCRFFALLEHFDSPLALSRLLWLYLSRDCCCNCDRDFWKFEFHPSFTNSSRETLKILEFTKGNSERNGSTRWKFFFLSSARS